MIRLTEDWVIGPHFLNHIGFGYNRLLDSNSSFSLGQDWPSKIGLTGVAETTFPQILFTGTSYQGGTLNTLGRNNAGVEPTAVIRTKRYYLDTRQAQCQVWCRGPQVLLRSRLPLGHLGWLHI